MRDIILTVSENGYVFTDVNKLGQVGENKAARLVIDVSGWNTGLDIPHYTLNHEKLNGASRTVFSGQTADSNGKIYYEIESLLLLESGVVFLQLEASEGETRVRTEKHKMNVSSSVDPESIPSGVYPEWYTNMISAVNALSDNITSASGVVAEAQHQIARVQSMNFFINDQGQLCLDMLD